MSKIFVIEDDESIRELVKIALEGYGHSVNAFESAEEALERMDEEHPVLAIFDIMLPGISGIEAVKKIRAGKFAKMPVIMLTAKDSEVDKIVGLDSGADDYVTKPFSVMELMARVRAQLRRFEDDGTPINLGKIRINEATREIFVDNKPITLTFKEYELVVYLCKNSHRVVSRDELLHKLWGYDYVGETRTVDIHIGTLRQKLGAAGDVIKTVRGMGYRAVGE